jgi:hypothetical protein
VFATAKGKQEKLVPFDFDGESSWPRSDQHEEQSSSKYEQIRVARIRVARCVMIGTEGNKLYVAAFNIFVLKDLARHTVTWGQIHHGEPNRAKWKAVGEDQRKLMKNYASLDDPFFLIALRKIVINGTKLTLRLGSF